jgi:hypothetical protein
LISALILEIPGLYVEYWVLIFSLSCFAIMLGLNVSATFNSAVTIYILIPLLLIPQLMLSGTVVKFDELNPSIASPKEVPLAADLMASRWAYEGLMVKFFVDNAYERAFFAVEQKTSEAIYRKDYWLPKMEDYTEYCLRHQAEAGDSLKAAYQAHLQVLRSEVAGQMQRTPKITFVCNDSLAAGHFSNRIGVCLKDYYRQLQGHYVSLAGVARTKHDAIDQTLASGFADQSAYAQFKQAQHNERIDKLVRNADSDIRLLEHRGEFVRQYEPVYNQPDGGGALGYRTHFYAPSKVIFGLRIDTYTFNVAMIWWMTILLYVTLHFELFQKMLGGLERLRKKG